MNKITGSTLAAVAVGMATLSNSAMAVDDYSTVLTGLSVAAIVTSIIAAGALKASPNFAKWAVNKLAGFFR